jgi:aryl-phospho-beta-D-glucosidase BglC (GH1 family)
MTTQGDQIINSEGQPVELKAVNWFGFNNQATMVNGLWGSDSMTVDFATVVYRMQLLGFNAIRLPFSFKDLDLHTQSYLVHVPPPGQSEIQASVTNPSVPVSSGKTIPPMVAPPARQPGLSNDYLPNDTTTFDRFLWVVNFFAKNGFYVLIDNHLREDQTVLENPQQWVQDWVKLVTAISQDPVSRKMLMIDILNEPDNFGIRWEASGGHPALKDLYLSAMDALYPINPDALFFIEGTGQGGIGANWGDGFATDHNLIVQNGLSDPNPFFQALLQKPYANQVVISPHVYPPSVTGASSNYTGQGLWNRLTASFGYLTQQGYCDGRGTCKVFPVAIGEFGSRFTESKDIQSMQDMAAYFNNSGAAADGKHRAIPNWFYWCWNANSGDTGGIVADNWRDIIWQKVDYLATIGLMPWYKNSVQPKFGNLCVSVRPVSGLAETDLKPIIAGSYSFNVTDFDTPVCESVQVGSYTVSAPRITAGNEQFDAEPQTIAVLEGETSTAEITYKGIEIPQGTFTVVVKQGSPWTEKSGSGIYKNVINLYVRNDSSQTVEEPWTIVLSNSAYVGIDSYWNIAHASAQNGTITATADQDWESLSANGGNIINVGMIVSSHSQNFVPTSITINGSPANIEIGQ